MMANGKGPNSKKLVGVMLDPETHAELLEIVAEEKKWRPRACKSSVGRKLIKRAMRAGLFGADFKDESEEF